MGKYFPVVGDLRPYGGTYQGGTVGQTGNGDTDQVRHVQHPERPKRGSGIVTSRDGAWSLPGNKAHKNILHADS